MVSCNRVMFRHFIVRPANSKSHFKILIVWQLSKHISRNILHLWRREIRQRYNRHCRNVHCQLRCVIVWINYEQFE